MKRELPEHPELLDARDWLLQGAPAVSKHCPDPAGAVYTLLRLLEVLPELIPMYAYGTDECKESNVRFNSRLTTPLQSGEKQQ